MCKEKKSLNHFIPLFLQNARYEFFYNPPGAVPPGISNAIGLEYVLNGFSPYKTSVKALSLRFRGTNEIPYLCDKSGTMKNRRMEKKTILKYLLAVLACTGFAAAARAALQDAVPGEDRQTTIRVYPERVRRKDQTGERRQPGPAARRRRDARMQPPRSVRRNAHPDHAAARRSAGESRHETGRSSADLRESRSGRGRSGQLLFRPDGRLYCELHRVRHGSLLPAGNLDRAQRQQIFRAPARRRAKMGRRRIERHPSLHGRKMERVPLRHPLLGDMERTRSGPENVEPGRCSSSTTSMRRRRPN